MKQTAAEPDPFAMKRVELTAPKYGITVELVGDIIAHAYARNGCLVVQVGEEGARLISTNAAGSAKNVPGYSEGDVDRGDATGQLLEAGDSLLLWVRSRQSTASEHWTSNFPVPGSQSRSRNARCLAVVFVKYEPVDGQLCPLAIGRSENELIRFGRSVAFTPDMVKVRRIPQMVKMADIDLSVDGSTFENLLYTEDKFCGEAFSSWNTDTRTPAMQQVGYGREVAQWRSRVCLFLMSDAPEEQRHQLACALVENGLSLAGAFMDGRFGYANGGHCQGRTIAVIAAGILLNIPMMSDPRWMGQVFQERHAWYRDGRSWWFGDWTSLWQYTSVHQWGNRPNPLDEHPSTWGEHAKWSFNGYYPHSAGANIGTALFARYNGCEAAIGGEFVKGILDQFMVGPPVDVLADMETNGVHPQFGSEYPSPPNGRMGFQLQAWKQIEGRK